MKTAPKLQEFVPLELSRCNTVGQILEAMAKTPVGSGMLGRLAVDLRQLIAQDWRPLVIFDGLPNSPVAKLLKTMSSRGWFEDIITSEQYAKHGEGEVVIVVGRFSERYEKELCLKPGRAFFVNQWGLAGPDQIQDGYFKDVVVADPCFVLPLLYAAFDEWFNNRPWPVDDKLLFWLDAFGGVASEFVKGARVFKAMADDPDCFVVFTATGVLTVAQMSPIVCDLIDAGKIQAMVTTGALLGHGLVYSLDLPHFRHDPGLDDITLAEFKLNRITDAIEPETNLDHMEEVIQEVLISLPGGVIGGSHRITDEIGLYLDQHFPNQRGILKSAYNKDVPIIIPAFFDSEIGNDIITHNRRRMRDNKDRIIVDLEADSNLLVELLTQAKKRGISTLGGGPPRNTPQNVPPLVEILNHRLNMGMPVPMYNYGCRICPDPIWLGHLGGCTYSEGISWRKFFPDAQLAEVHMDAMHAFPFLAKYVLGI